MKQAGFTLVEVLVALSVAALALTALTYGAGQYVAFQQQLQQRIQAQRVAANAWTRLHALPPDPLPLTDTIEAEGQRWRLRIQLAPTPLPGFQRMTLSVSPAGSSHVDARLSTVWKKTGHGI